MLFNFVTVIALASSTFAIKAPRSSGSVYQRSAFESNWRRQEDPQKSLTLDPKVIAKGFESDGNPSEGQVASLTSKNNFINFCLTQQGVPLTDGLQIETGSCNQVIMGRIASNDKMPRSKFVFPANLDESLVENTKFTMKMKIVNIITGNFVNAKTNYYAAPQHTDDQGTIIGHSHVVMQKLPDDKGFQFDAPLDPLAFQFFKGINNPADGDGIVSVDVVSSKAGEPDGLPAGKYRMCSINAAANHQPVLVARAQHGWLDDCVYFTVKPGNGGNNNNVNNNAGNGNAGVIDNGGKDNANPGKDNANPGKDAPNNGGNKDAAANLQKFTGTLGATAPAVTKDGDNFKSGEQTFNNAAAAVEASCNTQRNSCADKSNQTGGKDGVTIPKCDEQRDKCMAGNAPKGTGKDNLNKFKGKTGANPVVISSAPNNQCFTDGVTLPAQKDCVQRACDAQRNKCADKLNGEGKKIDECDKQRNACLKQ